jgi:Methyltransferase domain
MYPKRLPMPFPEDSQVMMKLTAQILVITVVLHGGVLSESQNNSDGMCGGSQECGDRCHKINEMFMKENGKSHWSARYPAIARTLQEYGVKVSIEIGIARGGLSYYLLGSVGELDVHHGIDSFAGSNVRSSKRSSASVQWASAVLYHMRDFGCRFRLHNGFSAQIVTRFPIESVDCVIFDADHSYEGLAIDIAHYAPLVRKGGLLIFDDYDDKDFHGVRRAVDQLAKQNDVSIRRLNDDGNVMIVKPVGRSLNTTLGSPLRNVQR